MQFKLPDRLPPWLVVVASFLAVAAVSVTFALVDDNGDGTPDRVTITVNTQPRDGAPTKTIAVPESALDKAETQIDHEHLRDESPPGVPDKTLDKIDRAEQHTAAESPLVEGGASVTQRGCATRFVRNQSSRNGVKPQGIVWHYTVTRNVFRSTLDLDVLDGIANNPSAGVSWNYSIDREGNCHYNVPEDRKAWHAAAANPFYIGIEVVNYGDEGSYMDEAGYRKLAIVSHDASKRWKFPLAAGTVSNCVPQRRGIITHQMLGGCGGGHHDISPYSFAAVLSKVQRYARDLDGPTSRLTKRERNIADERCARRRQVIAAAKGSTARRAALGASRIARRQVRDQMRKLTVAKRRSGKPWRYRNRGVRRHELASVYTGKGCGR